jgi:IS30 family transposase
LKRKEGDLIVGRCHLVTLVERHGRYLLVLPVKDGTSGTVITAIAKAFARYRRRCAKRSPGTAASR